MLQDFIFAVKVPQVITHEKVLVAVSMFLGVEDRLTLPNPAASIN